MGVGEGSGVSVIVGVVVGGTELGLGGIFVSEGGIGMWEAVGEGTAGVEVLSLGFSAVCVGIGGLLGGVDLPQPAGASANPMKTINRRMYCIRRRLFIRWMLCIRFTILHPIHTARAAARTPRR